MSFSMMEAGKFSQNLYNNDQSNMEDFWFSPGQLEMDHWQI